MAAGTIVPDAVPTWNLVYIYADLEGKAEITNIWEIYIDKHRRSFPVYAHY